MQNQPINPEKTDALKNSFLPKEQQPGTPRPSEFVQTPNIPETTSQPEEQQPIPIIEQQQTQVERSREQQLEITPGNKSLDSKIDALKRKLRIKKRKEIKIPQVKDELTLRIEKVMEEGLEDAYKALSTIEQQEFKIKGEEVAWKIRQLLKKTHVKIKEIFKLLVEWLQMLPGINIFFLEQEAKIKADKILTMKNQNKEQP